MTATELRTLIQKMYKHAKIEMLDVLDERNDTRYWEGYKTALFDIMIADVKHGVDKLKHDVDKLKLELLV